MDNALYIVFSATPTGMGRLIRTATRGQYNHVSLSFARDIHQMYSFARYHRDIPLYGGLVTESILRYRSFAGSAQVKICCVEVADLYFTSLRRHLDRLLGQRESYIYNTPAALTSLIRRRPAIPKAHTCVTFVHEILLHCRFAGAETLACPTLRDLEGLLEGHVVYEGSALPLTRNGQWGEDGFARETTVPYAVYTTARHFGRLAKRAVLGVA